MKTFPTFACPAPLSAQGFALQPETADDLPVLRRWFIQQHWSEMVPLPWDDDQKAALLGSQFNIQRQYYADTYPGAQFLVLADVNGTAGRLYLGEYEGSLRVLDITIHPGRRGLGLGGALIGGLMAMAGPLGFGISLHAQKDNPAQSLYLRLGFQVTGDTGMSWRMDWHPGASPSPMP